MNSCISIFALAVLVAGLTPSPLRAQEPDTTAPAAKAPAAAVSAPAPTTPATTAPAAPAAAPVAAPAAAAPAVAAPAVAAPPAVSASTPAAAAPAPKAAETKAPETPAAPAKLVVNAATYTRDIGKLYAEMTKEADEFTASNQAKIQSLKNKEAEDQAKLDETNKDYAVKSKDPEVLKQTHFFSGNAVLKALKKEIKEETKDLEGAQRDTKHETEAAIDSMWEMEAKHLAAIKAKYKEVEGLVKAAESE